MTNLDSILKSGDMTLPTKVRLVKAMVFPVVGLWRRLSIEELMLLNCGVGEDSSESLGLRGEPVHPKGDQSWVFIGRTNVEAKTAIFWPPDTKSWLIGKDPDAGKSWRREEKGTTEDEMVGWHHRHNGHGFGWTPGVGDRQGDLVCCGSWGHKKSDTTEWLNWTELIVFNFALICFIQCSLYYLAPEIHFFYVSKCVSVSGVLFLHANDLIAIKDTDFAEKNENEHWFSTGLCFDFLK